MDGGVEVLEYFRARLPASCASRKDKGLSGNGNGVFY